MIEEIEKLTSSSVAVDMARLTVNKDALNSTGESSDSWWRKILMAEHSPVRAVLYKAQWSLPKWVSTHFVRHKVGVEHFVSTSRPDRAGGTREENEKMVKHGMIINAQAIINISRKRLCYLASKETRDEWSDFLQKLHHVDKIIPKLCVPECVYRGFCPEIKSCGYYATQEARDSREDYIKDFKDKII